jgi:hypothetical protein
MALALYDLINNINKQIKSICCKVNALLDSGAGSYRVYTALLTQSGGDDPLSINGDEAIPLTIGVTYTIVDNTGLDVTNVGAPNNNVGTSFVATGTTPNSWGNIDGWSIISYNSGAPVVTVLENTIGNIWFTYTGVGDYSINSDGLFENLKTYYSILSISDTATQQRNGLFVINTNQIGISSGDGNVYENGYLFRTPIEIRVYN